MRSSGRSLMLMAAMSSMAIASMQTGHSLEEFANTVRSFPKAKRNGKRSIKVKQDRADRKQYRVKGLRP